MLHYDYNEKVFKKTQRNLVDLYAFIQEVKLWKNENPMNYEMGVDYFSIFNRTAYAETEISKIVDKYINKFESLELREVKVDKELNVLNIIIFVRIREELIELVIGV